MILGTLAGGLIVSCQPVTGGPMDTPEIVAAFARAAVLGGAVGLRIEGLENLRAVRRVTDAPIIGLIKVDTGEDRVFITPTARHARDLVAAGADIVAVDATDRRRSEPLGAVIEAIRQAGAIAMADCACAEDGRRALRLGAGVLGSTLSGYTGGAVPEGPDLALVGELSATGAFVIAEGRYHAPADAAAAMAAGADAVVVGSAITRPEHVTAWFAEAIAKARRKVAAP